MDGRMDGRMERWTESRVRWVRGAHTNLVQNSHADKKRDFVTLFIIPVFAFDSQRSFDGKVKPNWDEDEVFQSIERVVKEGIPEEDVRVIGGWLCLISFDPTLFRLRVRSGGIFQEGEVVDPTPKLGWLIFSAVYATLSVCWLDGSKNQMLHHSPDFKHLVQSKLPLPESLNKFVPINYASTSFSLMNKWMNDLMNVCMMSWAESILFSPRNGQYDM